jgi:glycosyltransferase involved in cell wall biosynthesis
MRGPEFQISVGRCGNCAKNRRALAHSLAGAADAEGWPLHLGILSPLSPQAPGIPELLGVSEAVLLTSIQEGFGLPYLEAVAAGRPLVARRLPNIAPDLRRFGFRFPHGYSRILVTPKLFDWMAERDSRQCRRQLCDKLPLLLPPS